MKHLGISKIMLCHSAIEGRNRIFEGGTQEKK